MVKGTASTVTGLLAIAVLAGCGAPVPRAGGGPTTSPTLDAMVSAAPWSSPAASPSAIPSAAPSPTPAPSGGCTPGSVLVSPEPQQASALPTTSTSSTAGTITGHVTTPSEVIFPQLVYAISTAGPSHGAYSSETVWNQSNYTMKGVAAGTYFVYATNRPVECREGGQVLGAVYSSAVPCGLSVTCTNHAPLKVTVRVGTTTTGIDPIDWYTDTALMPPPPLSVVPADPPLQAAAKSYASAREAAVGIERSLHSALFVDALEACPQNRACIWVGTEHDGTSAAYFVGSGGSNGNWSVCTAYVYRDSAGWHGFRFDYCEGAFPAVGESGLVFVGLGSTECVNVRDAPGPKGAVVGCVKSGTVVQIDGGPVYSPMASINGVWWHLAGRGWIADTYLR